VFPSAVAVLRDGVLQQCDEPQAVYDHPANVFVAAFIGSPAMNLFEANLGPGARTLRLGSQSFALPETLHRARPNLASHGDSKVIVGVRPEDIPAAGDTSGAVLEGEVELVEALGSDLLVHFRIDAVSVLPDIAGTATAERPNVLSNAGVSVARVAPRTPVRAGERARFALDLQRLHFFDATTAGAIP
jgi:multiple sugar transport system ATP-binding protein